MNEELNKLLGKIQQKTPPITQGKSPEPAPGQVWYPRYTHEMKELLKTTLLLQKCRPVYIHAINGNRVTCFKVKTLHSPIPAFADGRKVNEVVFRDPGSEIRVLECAEVLTLHIYDFQHSTAQYMYTLNDTIQTLATLTYASAMDIPVVLTDEVLDHLNKYYKVISKGTPPAPTELDGATIRLHQTQVDRFNRKWSELNSTDTEEVVDDTMPAEESAPESTPEPTPKPKPNSKAKAKGKGKKKSPRTFRSSETQKELIPKIREYLSHIPESLKFANSKKEFSENHDGYIDDDGAIVIAAAIHKNIYNQMVSEGVIPEADKLGYYGYRALLMTYKICTDKYCVLMGKDGREKKLTTTRFSIRAASPEASKSA